MNAPETHPRASLPPVSGPLVPDPLVSGPPVPDPLPDGSGFVWPATAVPPSPPVAALRQAVAAVAVQGPAAGGLGSPAGADVAVLAAAAGRLQVLLGQAMAAWAAAEPAADPTGTAAAAGYGTAAARRLRSAAAFCAKHPVLAALWQGLQVTTAQIGALAAATRRLPPDATACIVAQLAPLLPGMTQEQTRQAVRAAVQIAAPDDAAERERSDYASRRLAWTGIGGGQEITAYLPALEAGAFTAAIDAIAEQLRAHGDTLTLAQRRADALAALVARATAHGLPTGGGLPAAVTLTVSATEAARATATDPATARPGRRPDPATTSTGLTAGPAAVRFAMCCTPITPAHHHQPPEHTSLLARIARTPLHPLHLGRATRLATPAQRKALQLRDGGCIIPGCDTPAPYTQPHHVTPWNLDGPTNLDNLASLCWSHHRQVELGTWTITPTPPGNPRPWQATRWT